jgi:hypothetical protein
MLHSEQASEEAIVALIKLINVAAARSASLAPNIKTESKDQEKIRTWIRISQKPNYIKTWTHLGYFHVTNNIWIAWTIQIT